MQIFWKAQSELGIILSAEENTIFQPFIYVTAAAERAKEEAETSARSK